MTKKEFAVAGVPAVLVGLVAGFVAYRVVAKVYTKIKETLP